MPLVTAAKGGPEGDPQTGPLIFIIIIIIIIMIIIISSSSSSMINVLLRVLKLSCPVSWDVPLVAGF